MKLFKKITSILLICMLTVGLFIIPSTVSDAEGDTVYFHKFTEALRTNYGNAPDKVIYNSDGSITFKNTSISKQKQCYFNLDKSMAASALATANAVGGSHMLSVTVTLDSCVNSTGASDDAEIKIWLDTTNADKGDAIVQEWQSPTTTVTYELDVTNIVASQMKGFYVCAMNYENGLGIAPNITFSAATVYKPIDNSKYFHKFTEALHTSYGNSPDKVIYNDDGSVTFKNTTFSSQKQCYFNIDKDLAATALNSVNGSGGNNTLYVTIRFDSCIDAAGNSTSAQVKLWLDTINADSGDPIITEWQSPSTTVTYELNVSNVKVEDLKGFYICAMNYSGGGIAPNITFSAVMTEVPVLEPTTQKEPFEYIVKSDNTAEITCYNGSDEAVVIPSQIDGFTVTSIGDEVFDYNYDIRGITIPDTVTAIGNAAFRSCSYLTEVTLPDSVKTIDKNAFAYCPRLETVNIGNSLEKIGGWTFEDCILLKNITLPDSVTSIGSGVFSGCSALTNISLPSKIDSIGNCLFQGCTALSKATIPSTVKSIGLFAFDKCDNLTINSWRGSYTRKYAGSFSIDFVTLNNGDTNSDNSINSKDSLLLKQFVANYEVSLNKIAADLNGDSTVNSKDSLYLKQMIANIIVDEVIEPLDESLSEIGKLKELYDLSWSDEFDGDKLNTDNWSYEGSWTHRNSELQSYCDTAEEGNVYVQNGNLVIEARKESRNGYAYSSGSIESRGQKEFKYGIMEMSAILPKGKGVWPAFWMLGVNPNTGNASWPRTGELDILELIGGGSNDATAYGTAHATDETASHIASGSSYKLPSGTFNDGYHTFGVIWTETDIFWYVDDTIYFTLDIADNDYGAFNQYDFYFILNLAIGGSWPGSPAADTVFPSKYIVDYVRVYQKAGN